MMEPILPRPYASHGGWLCFLLPLALLTSDLHAHNELPACDASEGLRNLLIVASIGMSLETLCILFNCNVDAGTLGKRIVNLLPGIITTVCFALVYGVMWSTSAIAAFLITALYHQVYIRIMRGLPKTFTFGEAAILVQGLMLFVMNAIIHLWDLSFSQSKPLTDFAQLNAIMLSALISLLVVCVLLALVPILRKPVPFYLLMVLLFVAVTCVPVTKPLPLIALLGFLFKDQKRLYIVSFYLVLVGLTCATVSWQLRNTSKANTRVRKIFHLLIVLVFVPGIIYQCALLYIGTGIALAIFVVVELLRLLQMPPFAETLRQAFDAFKDVKDAGQLALTPFCLLIGCALPIWITVCPCDSAASSNQLVLLSGILAVGVGDTAASVVGSTIGRNKWGRSSRSLEGTAAFVVSILLFVLVLQLVGVLPMTQAKWFATIFAALNTALVEAFTDQVDNLVLPLVFYILVGLA